jgi:hypothetical protein
MTDLFEPVRLSREAFVDLIKKVDQAFANNAAALVVDERYGLREVEVIDPTAAGFSDETWPELQPAVNYLDQLMLFAFDDAPDTVISTWAREYDSNLVHETIERVKIMRQAMPVLEGLWQAKSASVVPILNNFEYEVLTEIQQQGEMQEPSVLAYLSVSRTGLYSRPDRNTIERVTFRLFASDIVLLKQALDHAFEHTQIVTSKSEGEVGGNE